MTNTTLCYIEKDGCYLMLHRTKKHHDYNHDKWIGIGGKFESGESPEECVIREVKEETGLDLNVNSLEYKGIVTFVCEEDSPESGSQLDKDSITVNGEKLYTEFMHIFHATEFSGQLIECNEGDLEWVPIENMNNLPHWKGDEIFLDFLKTNKPFYSLKLEYRKGQLQRTLLNGKFYNHFI